MNTPRDLPTNLPTPSGWNRWEWLHHAITRLPIRFTAKYHLRLVHLRILHADAAVCRLINRATP